MVLIGLENLSTIFLPENNEKLFDVKLHFLGNLKLSDFGSSGYIGDKMKIFWSTIDYMAPGMADYMALELTLTAIYVLELYVNTILKFFTTCKIVFTT